MAQEVSAPMQSESSHDPRRRERVSENIYRRRTNAGDVIYEVKFRDVDGRWRSRTLNARTERAATKEARAILAGRDGGNRVVAVGRTLDELVVNAYFPFLDSLAAAGRRSERGVELYRDRYRLHLEPVLGHLRLGDIDARKVAELIASMRRRGYSESTISSTLLVLRGIYRLASRRGLVARSPIDGLDPAEVPKPAVGQQGRILDEQELAALVRHADDRHRAIVTVLAYSGLRLSEALGLRWQDVDLVDGELHVRYQLSHGRRGRAPRLIATKTRAGVRDVPLMPAVERALLDHLALEQAAGRGGEDDLVFVTGRGTPLNQRNVAVRGVGHAAAAAGLGKVSPHDLRRSFCSLAGRRNVDPVEAAQITGHSLAVWTKHYARSFGKPQRDEARRRLLEHGFGAAPDALEEAVPEISADIPLTPEQLNGDGSK
jgi:integrase